MFLEYDFEGWFLSSIESLHYAIAEKEIDYIESTLRRMKDELRFVDSEDYTAAIDLFAEEFGVDTTVAWMLIDGHKNAKILLPA